MLILLLYDFSVIVVTPSTQVIPRNGVLSSLLMLGQASASPGPYQAKAKSQGLIWGLPRGWQKALPAVSHGFPPQEAGL